MLKISKASPRSLKVKDVARIMLGSEPFHTYGFSLKSCKRVVKDVKKANLLLAKIKNEVVGFAIYETTFLNGYYLKLIAIDPKKRGFGIGNKLMSALEKETYKKKSVLYLCVTDFNRRAQKFYKKRGYEKVGRLTNYAKRGIAEILLRKVSK
jgi:[ribosomal protein S18]-alanine N-acetyltransferase